MYDGILARLAQQISGLDNPAPAEALGDRLVAVLGSEVPLQTGNLASGLLQASSPKKTDVGFLVGVGNKDKIGDSKAAPRGTIADFLKDYPVYKRRILVDSRFAWWLLSHEAKDTLQRERAAGKYGGSDGGIGAGQSAYLYPQEGSKPEWSDSGARAAITPQRFIQRSIDTWRETHVPVVIAEFFRRMTGA